MSILAWKIDDLTVHWHWQGHIFWFSLVFANQLLISTSSSQGGRETWTGRIGVENFIISSDADKLAQPQTHRKSFFSLGKNSLEPVWAGARILTHIHLFSIWKYNSLATSRTLSVIVLDQPKHVILYWE